MTLLPADSWTAQAWRNGGGRTYEILREGGDDFSLRVSVADVSASGPFSAFPGVDRVILLLEGQGFVLRDAAGVVRITEPGQPHAFAGESAPDCALVDGPVRDLNFMVDRRRYRLEVRGPSTDRRLKAGEGRQLLFALEAGVVVQTRDGVVTLGRHDLLDVAGPITVEGAAVWVGVTATSPHPRPA